MKSITRKSFITGTAFTGAGAYMAASTPAFAGGFITSLFGTGDEQEDTSEENSVLPAPDWNGYSAEEIAAIAVDALFKRDFETYLSLCAVEDFLDSMILQLTPIVTLRDDSYTDWQSKWEANAVKPSGAFGMLMAVRLRGLYAADMMRFLARVACDAAEIDLSMSREDPAGSINKQLVALNLALESLDLSQYQLMSVRRCDSIVEAYEMGWLDQSWGDFAPGCEAAASFYPEMGYDFSVFCCTVGQAGQEILRFILPLCRYGDTWRIQRPVPYDVNYSLYWYTFDDSQRYGEGEYTVCELPQVSYEPAPAPEELPFAGTEDATYALLASLGFSTSKNPQPKVSAQAFKRLFCSDAYMSSLDVSNMYSDNTALLRSQTDFLRLGTISSFFISMGYLFLPVTATGFRTLSAYMVANKFGAYPLIVQIYTCVRQLMREENVCSENMFKVLDAFSPQPTTMKPMLMRNIFAMNGGEEAYERFMKSEFSFKAIRIYLEHLNTYLERYGAPVAVYTARDKTAQETMDSLYTYLGGESKEEQMLFYHEDTGEWHNINFALTECEDGVRVSDIASFSIMTGILSVIYEPHGISGLDDVTPDQLKAMAKEIEDSGEVEDIILLDE